MKVIHGNDNKVKNLFDRPFPKIDAFYQFLSHLFNCAVLKQQP